MENYDKAQLCRSAVQEILSVASADLEEDNKMLLAANPNDELLAENQKQILQCAVDFTTKQLELLNAYIEANTPAPRDIPIVWPAGPKI